MNALSMIFSTFFGAGFFPVAPGTAASFITMLIYKLGLYKLSWPFQALIIVFLVIAGAAASTRYGRLLNRKDPGRIVIDETCGQLIALFLVTPGWKELLLAFILFRIFDILKPYPIKKLEALPHGWGIMADDVGAGLAAAVSLRLILLFL
jgi:phosphatidylglycerophosphatase A